MDNDHQKINISTATITLGQFLKLTGYFPSGGAIKHYLQEQQVFVNGQLENRRGKKLTHNDIVTLENIGSFIVTFEN